jgi:hypothetical protein
LARLTASRSRQPAGCFLCGDRLPAAEPATLDYEWFVSDDGHRVHLYERYVDSAGALAHLATFQQRYMTRFFDILQPERIVLYGSPNQAVRDTFAQLEGVTMAQAAGFSRRGGTDGSLPPARVRLPDDAARPSQPT